LAERLRAGLCAESIRVGINDFVVTASFGVADNGGVTEPDQLIRAADETLYQAKSDGRNSSAVMP